MWSGEKILFPVISLTHQHSSLSLMLVVSFLSLLTTWSLFEDKNTICIVFLVAEKQNTANFLLTFQVCCKLVSNVSVNLALQKVGFVLLQYRTGFSPCCWVLWGVVSSIIHFTFAFHSTTGCSSLTSLCLLYTGSGDDKLIRCCHHNCDWLLQMHIYIHIVDIIFRIVPTYTKNVNINAALLALKKTKQEVEVCVVKNIFKEEWIIRITFSLVRFKMCKYAGVVCSSVKAELLSKWN